MAATQQVQVTNGSDYSPGIEPLSVALDKLEEQLTCSVCNKQFTDPRTLPCLHSYCLECVQKIFVHLKVKPLWLSLWGVVE